MDEDVDISAAQLAAICSKGQYARSISMALSANAELNASPSDMGPVMIPTEVEDEEDTRIEGNFKNEDDREDVDEAIADSTTDGESSLDSDEDCTTISEIPLPQAAVHRRRTRLQRQRARERQLEFLAPFMRESDSEGESCAIGTVQGEDRPERVPTLMELCIHRGFTRAGPLPPGLKPTLSHHHSKTKLTALQLRWLGHNMAHLERQIKWNVVEALQPHGVKTLYLKRDARSLWRTDCWSPDWRNGRRECHPEECQWILPVSVQTFNAVDWKIATLAHYLNLVLPRRYSDSLSTKSTRSENEGQGYSGDGNVQQVKRHLRRRYPKLVKYCFDHAMAYVWWARGRCTLAQEAFMKVIQQYPADRKSETECSTLWARHKAMALVEIGRLLTSFDRPDSAGAFYRQAIEEAARNIHPDQVSKLTLQSLALTAAAYDQGVMDQHSAVKATQLWSATYQQVRWMKELPQGNYPTSDHYLERATRDVIQGAVESLVHCHAGYLTDSVSRNLQSLSDGNRAWLREARVCLEKLMDDRWAYVGLYLSFILAMLNEGIAAENAYTFSLRSFMTVPGDVARQPSYEDIKPHPWWLFKEWIEARSVAHREVLAYPLQVLPLVWRRGLGHPSYCHDKSTYVSREQVSEIQGVKTLGFHLTPEGHLSGAMVQNLPPLQTICLDPYSGKLHFGGSCCDDTLHQWDNYDQRNLHEYQEPIDKQRFNCNSSLPQPNVIYSNPKTLARVSLLIPGFNEYRDEGFKYDPTHTQPRTGHRVTKVDNIHWIHRQMRPAMSAIYQGKDKTVKLDIVELVLQEQKKYILDRLSKENEYETKAMREAQAFIDYSMKQRYETTLLSVKNYIADYVKESSKPTEPQRHHMTKEDNFAKYFHNKSKVFQPTPFFVVLLKNVLYIGKATVVLLLHMYTHHAFVFLDCSSPSAFSQAVVRASRQEQESQYRSHLYDRSIYGWALPDGGSCWKTQDSTANMLLAFLDERTFQDSNNMKFSHNNMHLFDEWGNTLQYNNLDASELRFFSICSGNKLIGTSKDRRRVIMCDLQLGVEKWSSDELPQVRKMAVTHNTLFLLTTEGSLALDINTLQPLVTVSLNASRYVLPSNERGCFLDPQVPSTGHFELFCPHETMMSSDGAVQYNRAFLGVDNHILLVQRRKIQEGQLLHGEQQPNVLEIVDIMIPGKPIELCYINQQDGFVVSATVFSDQTDTHYRENLYWFDMSGNLIAMHPFIGGGHHGFAPVYLKDPDAKADDKDISNKKDLYLYFADGLGAVCCIKLDRLAYK